jgi:hypothetical protein
MPQRCKQTDNVLAKFQKIAKFNNSNGAEKGQEGGPGGSRGARDHELVGLVESRSRAVSFF